LTTLDRLSKLVAMATASSAASSVASTDAIRAHFPALERRHEGQAVAYFDGPGGTQVPRAVGDAMLDYLYHHNANTHWAYPTSAETDALFEDARRVFAAFLHGRPDEVVFGANMTGLTMHVARALGRDWGPGDEVVTTELDHHANVAPWTALERERGVRVRRAAMRTEDGRLDWDDLDRKLSPRTRVLAVGAASNALGTINDLARARAVAKSVGALLFVDGVHSTPHVLPDVAALDCDFFACSAYKFYGPHVGVLWARKDLIAALDFPRLIPASHDPPERAETGTLNHEGVMGAAAAVQWLARLAGETGTLRERLAVTYAELHQRSRRQFRWLWEALGALRGVTRYGPPADDGRTPTAAFTVERVTSTDAARRLAALGLFLSHGDFYAHTVVERFGLHPEGLIRAGCACYTSDEEIERLIEAVGRLAVSG
jgi:cysteine desulfurase family protein (TIGR01976 family)